MKYLLICGGVGGAKLALGFSKAIDSNSIDKNILDKIKKLKRNG